MSYIADFKSPPISLFGVNGVPNSTDLSLSTLVGTPFVSADGRVFVVVQNGAVALVAGNLVQGPASIGANHIGLAVVSNAAIGATQITVTLGGTAVTANQYAGGFVVISAGTGLGQTLRIASHPAQSTTSGNVVLTLEDPLSVAITSSTSKASLTLNPYGSPNGAAISTHGVVVSPSGTSSASTGKTIGVTIGPIPASSTSTLALGGSPTYGWVQTRGPVACLSDGAIAIGLDIMPGAVNGAITTYVVATRNRVGSTLAAAESAKTQLIDLQL